MTERRRGKGIGTRAVHGDRAARPGPLASAIVQSSTFVFESSEEMRRYLAGDPALHLYTRYSNPTLAELEDTLAALEGGERALVLASGMAAMTTALMSIVSAGDEVLLSASLYGGTTKLVRGVLQRFGVGHKLVPVDEIVRIGDHTSERSRVVVFETPTNPTVAVVDIEAALAAAHARGLLVVVDNTFATPFNQQPLALGADLVMHSLTKALSGHSDLIAGALVGSTARIEAARDTLKVLGGCLDPHAAFLVSRGIKTLHLRAARQSENAQILAQHLEGHAKIARVLYPGLASHPGHAVARKQMKTFGSMLTCVLKGGLEGAERFYDRLQLVARAASLGGVETIVSLPVHTSHAGYTADQLKAAGIDPGMVRLSLGVEDVEDVVADVDQALAAS